MFLTHQIQNWVSSIAVFAYPIGNLIYQAVAERQAKSVVSADFRYAVIQPGWLLVPVFLVIPASILWGLWHMRRSFIEVGWLLSLAMILFMLLLGSIFIIGLASHLNALRDAQRRTTERIRVSQDGVHFLEGNKDINAPWGEITDYYLFWPGNKLLTVPTYVVMTNQGPFDFTAHIRGYRLLKEIISRRAIHACVSDWQTQTDRREEAVGEHSLNRQVTN